jgi:predicted RNA-binding protein with PUA-like domain
MKADKLFLKKGKFWIFQSTVKNDYGFDIRNSCRVLKKIEVWPVNPHARELQKGDFCFIWACGLGNKELSGIYSIGKLISDIFPAERKLYPEYRPKKFKYPGKNDEVLVQYIFPLLKHVSERFFLSDPNLKESSIITGFRRATVFPVKEEEKQIILSVIDSTN